MTIIYSHYGVPEIPISIVNIIPTYLSLRVIFSDPVTNNAELNDISNYSIDVINPDQHYAFGLISITPEPNVIYPTYIDIEITDCSNNGVYELIIEPNSISNSEGELIQSGTNTFEYTGYSELPEVLSANSTSLTTMLVIFSKIMAKNQDLLDKSKYSLSGGLNVLNVEHNNETSVILTTTLQSPFQIYDLTVG